MAEETSQIKKGKFIVFEGIDGSGKTTLADYLRYHLSIERKRETFSTAEPTHNHIGRQIREILQGTVPLPPRKILANLFVADRFYHSLLLRDILHMGINVICDRYIWSNFAYNSSGPLEDQLIEDLHFQDNWYIPPDYVFFLDLTPEMALLRLQQRLQVSVFDKLEVMERAYIRYREVLSTRTMFGPFTQLIIVDANKSLEDLKAEMKLIVIDYCMNQ